MEHMEMKILQPIFGILVVLTKNKLTKICNKQGTRQQSILLQPSIRMKKKHFIYQKVSIIIASLAIVKIDHFLLFVCQSP